MLWNEYDTPLHIRKHCMAVAEVAKAIGLELNKQGHELDIELIYAAGLTHDVVRLKDRHDLEGAKIMVIEHTYVGVDARYQYIIDKASRNGHPEAAVKIRERKQDVRRLINEIEQATGKSLEEIAKGIVIE